MDVFTNDKADDEYDRFKAEPLYDGITTDLVSQRFTNMTRDINLHDRVEERQGNVQVSLRSVCKTRCRRRRECRRDSAKRWSARSYLRLQELIESFLGMVGRPMESNREPRSGVASAGCG